MKPNEWTFDGRGRRVFKRLDVMRSVDQCAERALRGPTGLFARLDRHRVSDRQAARIIGADPRSFGAWRRRARWPAFDRAAQALAFVADLDAGALRPREVFEVEAGRYAGTGPDFAAMVGELEERGFAAAQVCGQARIEARMLAKVRLGHPPPYAAGRRVARYVLMVRGGDVAPEPVRLPAHKPIIRRWRSSPGLYRGLGRRAGESVRGPGGP